MLRNIALDLTDDAVGHPAAVAPQLMLVFAHLFQLQQQRGQQHFAGHSAFGAVFVLHLDQLLQDGVDIVLLLNRDVAQQVVVLLAHKAEQVNLRESPADLLQILAAEIAHNAAGGAIPYRTSLVDLVFPNQDHIACIDDIGGILNKIAPRAFHFIIQFIFVVCVETSHIVAMLAVDHIDIKVHMGGIGIFLDHPVQTSRHAPPKHFCQF